MEVLFDHLNPFDFIILYSFYVSFPCFSSFLALTPQRSTSFNVNLFPVEDHRWPGKKKAERFRETATASGTGGVGTVFFLESPEAHSRAGDWPIFGHGKWSM